MMLRDQLKTAVGDSGLTLYAIAKGAKVAYPVLHRFNCGKRDLMLETASRLAAYLGLRLAPDPDAKPLEPTPANLARPMLAKTGIKRRARK